MWAAYHSYLFLGFHRCHCCCCILVIEYLIMNEEVAIFVAMRMFDLGIHFNDEWKQRLPPLSFAALNCLGLTFWRQIDHRSKCLVSRQFLILSLLRDCVRDFARISDPRSASVQPHDHRQDFQLELEVLLLVDGFASGADDSEHVDYGGLHVTRTKINHVWFVFGCC